MSHSFGRRAVLGMASAAMLATATGYLISGSTTAYADEKPVRIVLMPKLVGIPFYASVKQGIDEALANLPNVEVVWQGPQQALADQQIQMIDNVILTKPDVIGVAANDPAALVPVLQKARNAGIKVMTWDGDANDRDLFINLVDGDTMGAYFVEEMVKQIGPKGDVAIITSNFAATNQVAWIAGIEKRIAEKYPDLKIVTTLPSEEDQQLAFRVAQDIVKGYPNVKGIFGITSVAFPGAAEAVRQAGLSDKIAVVGNAQPSVIRKMIKDGVVQSSVMFNPVDMGYLTVYAATELARNDVKAGTKFTAGRLGEYTVEPDAASLRVTLGPPNVFTKENIDSTSANF